MLVDAREDEAGLVKSFGTLGAGADADGRERMTYAREKRRLLREGTTVTHYGKSIHLETVVIVKAEWLVLNDAGVKLESRLQEAVATARVAAVEDWHIVLLCHRVYGVEEAEKVLLRVDILLAVGAKENVPALF